MLSKILSRKKIELIAEISIIMLVFFLVFIVNKSNYAIPNSMARTDLGNEWAQAKDMQKGKNPYEKILTGNLIENNKYSTLFPFYYYFLMVVSLPSGIRFDPFIENYRVVIQVFEYGAFLFLYLIFRQRNQKLLGLFLASFYIFNRWTVLSISTLKQDVIAQSFLLASFYFLDKKIRLAYLLYGVSLGIKHLGIFVMPVFLAPLIFGKRNIKDFLIDFSLLLSPVVLPAIYFLIVNFKAFIYSMIFSFTRKPASSCGATPTGYEKLLVNYNNMGKGFAMFYLTLPRLPLVLFTVFNTILFFIKKIKVTTYLLMAYIIFAALNPVYFEQYITWVIPFAILVGAKDFLESSKTDSKVL
jgi:hypothetical protein